MIRIVLVLVTAALAVAALAGAANAAAPKFSPPASVKKTLTAGGHPWVGVAADGSSAMAGRCTDYKHVRLCDLRIALNMKTSANARLAALKMNNDAAFRERSRKQMEHTFGQGTPDLQLTLVGHARHDGRWLIVGFTTARAV